MTDINPEKGSERASREAARQASRRSIEALIDEIAEQSFPASDPPAWGIVASRIEQAKRDFEISNIGVVHRLGKLEVGETSVVISVAAPHRKAAFAACEWLIRELKRTVPIWKKEVYADGEEWIEGESAEARTK